MKIRGIDLHGWFRYYRFKYMMDRGAVLMSRSSEPEIRSAMAVMREYVEGGGFAGELAAIQLAAAEMYLEGKWKLPPWYRRLWWFVTPFGRATP